MDTLEIYAELTMQKSIARDKRITQLLREPDAPYPNNWFMYVPRCFNDALDIKEVERVIDGKRQTIWTQGSTFSFSGGQTIYDTPKAYEPWRTALQYINLCVQVERALPTSISEKGIRNPGEITLQVLTPDSDRTRLIERGKVIISQDYFVKFLISGTIESLLCLIKK